MLCADVVPSTHDAALAEGRLDRVRANIASRVLLGMANRAGCPAFAWFCKGGEFSKAPRSLFEIISTCVNMLSY